MANILLLSHYALPHLGGIEVVVDALAREFVALGHQVTHISADTKVAREQPVEQVSPPPYEIIRVPALNLLENKLGVPWPIFDPRLLPRLFQALRTADVVHAHGMLYLPSALGLLWAKKGRHARILTEHVGHVPYENPFVDRIEKIAIASIGRAAARSADAITVLNEKVRAEMAALAPGTRCVHIPNGVDMEKYHPPTPGEHWRLRAALGWDQTPRLLFVGRLVKKKGIDFALATAKRLHGRAHLVVVGPGGLVPDLNVEYLGPLPPRQVAELYRAADLFFLPSQGEGFPLTAQEAMASGLPVILAEDKAYEPYLGGGMQTAPRDPRALAAAIETWLDPVERANAGKAASQRAQRDFSWRVAARSYLALYDEIRSAHRPR